VSSATSNGPSAGKSPVQIERFQGGRNWLVVGGVGGIVLLLASIVGLVMGDDAARTAAAASYLVAFAYWAGIAMAMVILLMIFHATRAKWMVVLRRPVEAMGATMPLFLLLFIPVVIGMHHLYSWVEPAATLPKETLKLLEHKRPWLNPSFFIGRGFFYILLISVVVGLLFSWSKKQDATGEVALSQKQRNVGSGALPFVGLALTFASFDWLMSLNPTWFSTVFGVYFFGGSFVSALSLLAIVTSHGSRNKDHFSAYISPEHTHNIGKLMLAFTCFWTYIAFSQLLLIWIAGLPEETPFYITRFNAGWRGVGIFMIVGNFFAPFGALLSRTLKRDSGKLRLVAAWILIVHFVDIYWLVMPTFYPDGVQFHWTTITAAAGIGLLAAAFGVSRLRGQYALPIRDPYLADSLRYKQP
jgi:hypothetical protein